MKYPCKHHADASFNDASLMCEHDGEEYPCLGINCPFWTKGDTEHVSKGETPLPEETAETGE